MIYTPDWELLADALQRVVSAHEDLEVSKAAICNAIADKKIAVRVTVDRSHESFSGRTFVGDNIDVPVRINCDDFDWGKSRPLQPWRIGPRPGEHYSWIGGWKPEPIEMIELRREDVTKVLRCDDRDNDVQVITYAEAVEQVGTARFADDWIGGLTGHEEYVLDAGAFGGPSVAEFSDVQDKAREIEFQCSWAENWLEERGFLGGAPLPRAKFERELIEAFPWKVSAIAPVSWSPPRQLTGSRLIELGNEPAIWLSDAVNLMAFGNVNAPKERHLVECVFRRRQATIVLFEAARKDIVRLIGSPDVEGDSSDTIPPRYFDFPRNLGDPDNSISTDLDRASDAAFSGAFHRKHQKWFNARVDGPSFVAWLMSRGSPSHADEHVPGARAARSQPSRERAKRALVDIYNGNIPDQATEPNPLLCRKVAAWLKKRNLADVKDDTILRAAGRRK